MDKLVTCKRCGGDACYEQVLVPDEIKDTVTTWMCLGCGFTSSTLMTREGKLYKDLLETSPELYKDLLFEDNEGLVWAPSTITLPGKGMVFLDGTSKTNWTWTAVRAARITEEDRTKQTYPKDQDYKMDMKNKKLFGQKDFMDAMEYIGFFSVEL